MSLPNILFMTSHDIGDWLGCYGHKTVHTPNLDKLAAKGCRFDNNFCTSPICAPSRGAMMTGRYPQTNGIMGNIQAPYHWRYNKGERHLSHLLDEQGYHTVLFNFQHEATFDNPLGFRERRAVDTGSKKLMTGEHVSTAEETAEEFIKFLKDYDSESNPFYAQIGFFETHTPYNFGNTEMDDSLGIGIPPYMVDEKKEREHIAGLQGAIRGLDEAIGQILSALSESGLEKDTIIIFVADHGVEFPHCKCYLYDGGIHSALLMKLPRSLSKGGKICDWLISNIDVAPTLFDLLDLPCPDNLQGRSFADFFRNDEATPTRETVFAMMQADGKYVESRCIRTTQYKLIRNFSPSRAPETPFKLGEVGISQGALEERPLVELYDLHDDPYELNNLGLEPSLKKVRKDLNERLFIWLNEVKDPILKGPTPTAYYRMAIADLMKSNN